MRNLATNEEIAALCQQLGLLLHAGIGMGDALALLAEQSGQTLLLSDMARQVDGGAPLSQALAESGHFPQYVCGLLEVGERTGHMEEALSVLAQYYYGRVRLDRQVRSALFYPAVLLLMMMAVIAVLLIKVLPVFEEVYASLGGRLTGVAGGLLSLGRWLDKAMPVLWVLLAIVAVWAMAFAVSESFREKLLAWWQERFGDHGIARRLGTARLAQALAMGMASGLPEEESLRLASGLLEGAGRQRCLACQQRVEAGERFADALRASDVLPADRCRLLELGQRSGSGDITMKQIASDLSDEGEAALERLVNRVEPALVLVCSVLVGAILLSVMLPLMHIMTAIG